MKIKTLFWQLNCIKSKWVCKGGNVKFEPGNKCQDEKHNICGIRRSVKMQISAADATVDQEVVTSTDGNHLFCCSRV